MRKAAYRSGAWLDSFRFCYWHLFFKHICIQQNLSVGAEIDADELLRAFDVGKSIGDGRIAPSGAADDLDTGFELKLFRIGFSELQFAVVGKNQQMVAKSHNCARATLGLFP